MGNAALSQRVGNSTGALDQALALDVQGVDALRRTVRNSPQEGLKQASKQFEVMFMQMMLKSMRDATPTEGLFGSQQEKMYTSMLDQQLAQNLSGRGLGLAELMLAQLSRTVKVEPSAARPDAQELTPAPAPAGKALPARTPEPAPLQPTARTPDLSIYEEMTGQAAMSSSMLPRAHVEQFVSRLMPAAQRASQESGIPAQVIMAQAALESGWGRREIRSEDGRPSFNLFGIKADRSWRGPVIEATTTEYVNGNAQKTRASFRAYASHEEAFTDYARFLSRNPRYASVRNAQSPSEAALGLQQAGFASDPQYGGKLIRIMKQMS